MEKGYVPSRITFTCQHELAFLSNSYFYTRVIVVTYQPWIQFSEYHFVNVCCRPLTRLDCEGNSVKAWEV